MVRGWVSYGLRWLSSNLRVVQESFERFFFFAHKRKKEKEGKPKKKKRRKAKTKSIGSPLQLIYTDSPLIDSCLLCHTEHALNLFLLASYNYIA
jgi:hypothetical protein